MQSALDDLRGARESFEAASKLAPDYVPPIFNLAKLDLAQGEIKSATARLEKVIERNPRSDAALMALADIMLAVNDREAALNWLDKAAAAAPDAVNTQVRLIEMRLVMNQREEALNTARRLVDRNPENALALETLARVQTEFEKRDLAARNFRTAVRYAGYDGSQLMRIARSQVELQDYAEARKTLVKATNSGSSAHATSALIRLDTRLREFETANQGIEALRASDPQAPLPDILLGELYLQEKNYAAALAAYENAQLKSPSAEAVAGIADVYIARGDYVVAIERLEKWSQDHPHQLMIARKLAIAYLPVRELDKARALHESLLKDNPDDPVLLANLARLYQLAKDDRARAVAEKAQRLAPNWPVALDTLGWILVTEGETERGLGYLRDAIARQNNPLTRYHLAQALNELGRPTEARAELNTIIAAGKPEDLVKDARRYLDGLADSR
jgi:cellulose synthase operon protein C